MQKGAVRVPNIDLQEGIAKKLMWKWYREHVDLEYVMDSTQKTEKIAAPSGKHDDYCDSSMLGVHSALSMLPASAALTSVTIKKKGIGVSRGKNSRTGLVTTGRRVSSSNRRFMRGL